MRAFWYDIDGRVEISILDSDYIRLKIISDFFDSPHVGHVGINEPH